ncbi:MULTISPECIES: RagB/SusD family nutrient uptake outer membrane protein [Flavobacterium]|uniref:SusD family protein n=1 Tax=Flavobacterium anhuiense TaxID=459526 RepID=A0AAC9D1H3_9FLAO|nr:MULTISPECIES: RagB/SusD family nutrient uptake outer membrane protein [Flavobacterium]AOC95899.1 SusD family protein [Flavobacterium anhuiense]MXO05317.1 RagB/SusD family nutrient uptake outer membrane protein [Flavobacterium sp. HBTb2-11-1]URM36744.1 RagB/SusD family nutrient uptake outer membrane protein [Flavobacterium anhuiense]SCY65315.1 SusD family protein [Flavobacterium anhuiense]
MKQVYILLLSLMMLTISSCEEYTEITPKGALVIETPQQFLELVSLPNRGYPINNFQYLSDDQWMREANVIGRTPNIDIINFTFDETIDRVSLFTASSFYNQAYTYINRWNTVISLVDDSKGDESIKQLAKAEAKIYRAYDHFLLVNTYAKAYDPQTAATDGGICIMDKFDLEAQPSKSTVAQVYDFIQKDIEDALPYLKEKPMDVYHPSLAFAYAFKAKVHLFKREIAAAQAAAEKSLSYNNQIFDMVAYSAKGGPTSVAVPAADNIEVLSYMYMTGYNEMNFAQSYIISPELRTLFGTNDARFNLFFNSTSTTNLDQGSNTAYWGVQYTRFFYPTVGMKTTEVYLMLAECYARDNKLNEAVGVLNTLRAKRILSGTVNLTVPATRKETMELVVNERRKELLLGFNRFFDLKRLNTEAEYAKTITRVFPIVNKTVPQKTYTLQPNSRLYIIPFPLSALTKNPKLTLNTDEKVPF